MIEVEGPDGAIQQFPAGTPDADIDAFMSKKYGVGPAPSGQIEVEGPDGRVHKFAAGTDDEMIDSYMSSMYPPEPEREVRDGWLDKAFVASGGALEGVPVVGPLLRRGVEKGIAHTMGTMHGLTPEEALQRLDAATAEVRADNPVTDVASQIGGSMAVLGPLAATKKGASLLGITGKNPVTRALKAGGSGGLISGADQAARDIASGEGIDPSNVGGSTILGGGVSAAIPVVGAGLRAATKPIREGVKNTVGAALDPKKRAAGVATQAYQADEAAGQTLSPDDIATAVANRQPIMNVDRGGGQTRALARSAGNQSPIAFETMKNLAQTRFEGQTGRTVGAIKSVAGDVDDLGAIDRIRSAARVQNKANYDAAYNHPSAGAVFTPRIQELMQSERFLKAVGQVSKKSSNRAALEGGKAVKNPFIKTKSGEFRMKKGVAPTLEFWDHVQRNLRSMADKAARKGDFQGAGEIRDIRTALLNDLDSAVPAFGSARSGAAAAFGAEDAVDAGRMLFRETKALPEQIKALKKMKPAERDLLRIGYGSEMIDNLKAKNFGADAMRAFFNSAEQQEKMIMAFGKQGAKELESFVRVERAMDAARAAFGNSTTAKQLIETGAVGAGGGLAGYYYSGGDWATTAVMAGASMAGRAGLSAGAKKINEKVMTEVVDLLMSTDPKAMEKAMKRVAVSKQHKAALEAIHKLAEITARSAAVNVSAE
jgi:hypothetical protein